MKYKHLILPLAAVALRFVSCDKPEGREGEEPFEPHPTWTDDSTNNFWDKQQLNGLQVDTLWDGDTTIIF